MIGHALLRSAVAAALPLRAADRRAPGADVHPCPAGLAPADVGDRGLRLFTILQVAILAPLGGGVAWVGDRGAEAAELLASARPDLRTDGLAPDVIVCLDALPGHALAALVREHGRACWLEAPRGCLDPSAAGRLLGPRLRRVGGLSGRGRDAWWSPGRHAPGPPPLRLARDDRDQASVDAIVRTTARTPLHDLRA